jgi:glycosyltransferase involved in cell wall biosynthesis
LLTPPGDVEALGRTLTRALSEPQLRAGLLAAAELRAQEFSMLHLGEAYAERYERLA